MPGRVRRSPAPARGTAAGARFAGARRTAQQHFVLHPQDDAHRAGERDRLLLDAQRARMARRPRAGPAAPMTRLARLLFRRATA
jgi:hypothetical protein